MKKVVIVSLILLVLVSLLGLVFSRWFETLNVSGQVNTGEVDAEWSTGRSYDTEPPEKDFSSISCWVDQNNPHLLHVKVEDAYPCIVYTQEFDIHNVGTLPVHVGEFVIDRGNLPEGAQVSVEYDYEQYGQLHPSEEGYGKLTVHLANDAEERATYEFTVSVEVEQWNE